MSAPARHAAAVATDLGTLVLVTSPQGLENVRLQTPLAQVVAQTGAAPVAAEDHPVLATAAEQVRDYLAGEQRAFDLPLDRSGLGGFALAVSDALLAIPYGHVASYGDLATTVGSPGAARAVGRACNHNPLPLVVPCHRVVASDGSLGGFALGLDAKRRLLALEGAPILHGGWPRRQDDRQLTLELP